MNPEAHHKPKAATLACGCTNYYSCLPRPGDRLICMRHGETTRAAVPTQRRSVA